MADLGIDIGGTSIKLGLFNENGQIVSKKSIPYIYEESAYDMIVRIKTTIFDNRESETVGCVGVSVAANTDENGALVDANNLSLNGVDLKALMEDGFQTKRVAVINDADAAAYAELKAGGLRGVKNAVMLTLGTGVGGAVILNGDLFTGGNGRGVEIGHMVLDKRGPACTCGNTGCMEMLCSATWIASEAKRHFPGETIDTKALVDRAKAGDATACGIMDEFKENLTLAMDSLIAVFDPERILIGGGVSQAGSWLLDGVSQMVAKTNIHGRPYDIQTAQLGNDAGIRGAVLYAKHLN